MSYNTTSVTSALGLSDWAKTIIDAHAAWQWIETVVGTSTKRTEVYKCLGSVNSFGTDFYVGIYRASDTTGIVGLILGETYDSTAKTFGKGAMGFSSTPQALAGDGSFATPQHVANAIGGNNLALVGSHAGLTGLLVLATGSVAQLSVTNDRILMSWQSTTAPINACAYAGLYDPMDATTDTVPLVVTNPLYPQSWSGTISTAAFQTNNVGAFTREPNAVSLQTPFAMAAQCDALKFMVSPNMTAAISKDPWLDQWWSSPIRVAGVSRRGITRGYLKPDVQGIFVNESTEALADIIYFGASSTQPHACMAIPVTSGSPFTTATLGSVWVDTAA